MELPLIGESAKRPILRYHGGKWSIAPWVISHFPEHRSYIEPFGGAASVLIRKPRSKIEVYNDLDRELVTLFQILRDPSQVDILTRSLSLTPFSRAEFAAAYEPCADPLEASRRLVVRSFFGFGSHSHNADNSNGFRWMPCKSYAREWATLPLHLQLITERLQGVTLECQDARQIITQQDRADALFFIDPPYPLSARDCGSKGYRHEMSDGEHRNLSYLLHGIKGKVIICGYPCDLYNDLYRHWRRVDRAAYAGGQSGRVDRTECLWLNFNPILLSSPFPPLPPVQNPPVQNPAA